LQESANSFILVQTFTNGFYDELAKSIGPGPWITFDHYRDFLRLSGARKPGFHQSGCCTRCSHSCRSGDFNKNDLGLMEKKIDKKFYLLSSVNIISALILGGGLTMDSLALMGALVVLVINHTVLVNIVRSVTMAASGDTPQSVGKILMLMGLKLLMLFSIIALIYFYKKELITKVFLIIFFQLIIQIVSIKNNYQK
jgi:hypothetical protein